MNFVENLAFPDIRVIQSWRSSPIGTLLQINVQGEIRICMHVNFELNEGRGDNIDALVVVSGVEAGLLLLNEDGVTALDVGNIVEMIATTPATAPILSGHPPQTGSLFCMIGNSSQVTMLRARDLQSQVALFVCVAGDGTTQYPFGSVQRKLAHTDWTIVSPKIGTRVRT